MAIYLVTKLNNGKKNTYLCNAASPSSTLSIPGEYIQISYANTDNVFNMDSGLSIYNAIYFDGGGTKQNVYIAESSFDSVFEFFRRNYDITDFLSINKTDYVWYELR